MTVQALPEETENSSQKPLSHADPQPPASGEFQHLEDSPELLRWRADILLDEMMLSAVDIAAGRPDGQAKVEDAASVAIDEPPTVSAGYPASADPSRLPDSPQVNENDVPHSSGGVWRAYGQTSSAELDRNALWGGEETGESAPPSYTGAPDANDPVRTPSSPDRSSSLQPDDGDKLLRPPTASVLASGAQSPYDQTAAASGVLAADSAVRRGDAAGQPFDAPDRRNNLLPRESQSDVSTHLHEIDRLEAEVEAVLPVEHEWYIRSRHLLAKAANILQHSPERSAEVDYYLQQVRAIVERAQQTEAWSKVYVKRLKTYLIAWALFSVVGLVASLLYADLLSMLFVDRLSDVGGNLTQHTAALLATLSAGTLGASLGALRNMARYRRLGRGYIDRKYSLRGLLLPLLALIFGLLLYLLFALVYTMVDVNPIQNPLLGILPALIAFVFGLMQESLYGTAP